MIDRTKPAPGWQPPRMVKGRWRSEKTTVIADNRMQADCIATTHTIYTAESRPAVVDFAERVAEWAFAGRPRPGCAQPPSYIEWSNEAPGAEPYVEWMQRQLVAAARGERTIP